MTTFEIQPLERRARAYSESVTDRAARVFGAAFGGNWADGSAPGEAFHLAHNWAALPSLTREQRRACRIVNNLRDKRFLARRIVDRLYHRKMREEMCLQYNGRD